MADPDLVALSNEIRVLSGFLNAAGSYWWPQTPQNEGDNMTVKSFAYISTLLGIDADIPVAVTGIVTAENVTITIVSPRPSESQEAAGQDFTECYPVPPSERSLREILIDKGTPQSLGAYVADLIALFAAVHSGTILRTTTIIEWVIYRGWSKLDTWMKRSETDFKGDLFDLMEAWSPDDDDDIPARVVLMPITGSVYDKYELTANRTERGTTFTLNKRTASSLVKTIARMFRDIRQAIADPEVDRSEAAFSLVDPFVWLHVVLGNKPVEALMTETSLRFALVAEWPKTAGQEHTDGWDPLPGYNCLRESYYGLRYLRMLVACATSVFRLADAKVLPLVAAANATIVSIVAGLASAHDTESERRRVLKAIVDEIERNGPADALWPKASSKWIRWCADRAASGEQEISSHLHPEAGLMALACEARLSRRDRGDNSQRDEYGSAFSGIAQTPIGISGKCCPLCLRLTQLLNAHFASLGDSAALVFSQPETHGKVLPWDPPQFGIPKSVLTQLRDELREKLVEKAIAVGKPRTLKVDTEDEVKHKEDILAIHSEIRLPFRF